VNVSANLNIFVWTLIGLGEGVSGASNDIIDILSSIRQFVFPDDYEDVSLIDCIYDLFKRLRNIEKPFPTAKEQKDYLMEVLPVLKEFIKAVLDTEVVPELLLAAVLKLRTAIEVLGKTTTVKSAFCVKIGL
jgi:hypothetical protein